MTYCCIKSSTLTTLKVGGRAEESQYQQSEDPIKTMIFSMDLPKIINIIIPNLNLRIPKINVKYPYINVNTNQNITYRSLMLHSTNEAMWQLKDKGINLSGYSIAVYPFVVKLGGNTYLGTHVAPNMGMISSRNSALGGYNCPAYVALMDNQFVNELKEFITAIDNFYKNQNITPDNYTSLDDYTTKRLFSKMNTFLNNMKEIISNPDTYKKLIQQMIDFYSSIASLPLDKNAGAGDYAMFGLSLIALLSSESLAGIGTDLTITGGGLILSGGGLLPGIISVALGIGLLIVSFGMDATLYDLINDWKEYSDKNGDDLSSFYNFMKEKLNPKNKDNLWNMFLEIYKSIYDLLMDLFNQTSPLDYIADKLKKYDIFTNTSDWFGSGDPYETFYSFLDVGYTLLKVGGWLFYEYYFITVYQKSDNDIEMYSVNFNPAISDFVFSKKTKSFNEFVAFSSRETYIARPNDISITVNGNQISIPDNFSLSNVVDYAVSQYLDPILNKINTLVNELQSNMEQYISELQSYINTYSEALITLEYLKAYYEATKEIMNYLKNFYNTYNGIESYPEVIYQLKSALNELLNYFYKFEDKTTSLQTKLNSLITQLNIESKILQDLANNINSISDKLGKIKENISVNINIILWSNIPYIYKGLTMGVPGIAVHKGLSGSSFVNI